MSTLLNQIVTPYGYSNDDAGFMGVAMIVGGLIGAIAMAIFVDKTKLHKLAIKTSLFLSGIMYLILFFVGTFLFPVMSKESLIVVEDVLTFFSPGYLCSASQSEQFSCYHGYMCLDWFLEL